MYVATEQPRDRRINTRETQLSWESMLSLN